MVYEQATIRPQLVAVRRARGGVEWYAPELHEVFAQGGTVLNKAHGFCAEVRDGVFAIHC